MIRGSQVELKQLKERVREALRLASGEVINGLAPGYGLNCQVGVSRRSAARSGAFVSRPVGEGGVAEPDRQASPLAERRVIP